MVALLSIVVPLPAVGQPIDSRQFDHFSNLDGLSQVSVWTILQDRQGLLWFGTSDGLNRFDGYEFTIFYHNTEDDRSLSHRMIRSLWQDDDKGIWVGTGGGGLNFYDNETGNFSHTRHRPQNPHSLSHDNVTAITSDHQGVLWVGTEEGLNRLDSRQPWSFTRFPLDPEVHGSLSHTQIRALAEDREHNLWIGTATGLDRLSPDRRRLDHFQHRTEDPSSPETDGVTALLLDEEDRLWIGTDSGVVLLTKAGDFVQHLPQPEHPESESNVIRALANDGMGGLWVGSEGGLLHLDPVSGYFETADFERDDSPAKKDVVTLATDSAGALWLGTKVNGVYRHDPRQPRFAHYYHHPDDPDSLHYDTVYNFAEDQQGFLWVATASGGLNRLDAASGKFTHFRHDPNRSNSLISDQVRCLLVDRHDNLWIGTSGGGLDRLDPTRRQFDHFRTRPGDAPSGLSDRVLTLLEDRQGILWIGSSAGLDRFDPSSESFDTFDFLTGVAPEGSDPLVMNLLEDRRGGIWLGTRSGLYNYDGQTIRRYSTDKDTPDALSSDHVWSLLEDPSGDLWVGTGGGGLNRLDILNQTFTHFTTKNGLVNNVVYGIEMDDLGRLWISTNRGLARFEPQTGRWNHYDREDGLQDIEFNVGASFRDRAGRLYFGGVLGFNSFDPQTIIDNPFVPPVVLTSLEIHRKGNLIPSPSRRAATVELSHRERFFAFEFAALNYTRADKNRYAYRLFGFEEEWIDPGSRRFANYTNVPPGRYTFRVRGSNNDGLWNPQGASIDLILHPPWWSSWWAYTLYVLTAVLGVAGTILWQRRKLHRERSIAAHQVAISADLENKNAELERFVYTVSHDLKNPLVTIRNYIGLIRHSLPESTEDTLLEDLDRIDHASARMYQMLDELVELSRVGQIIHLPEPVHLHRLVHQALEGLAVDFRRDSIDWVLAEDLPWVKVDTLRVQEAMANLLENAMKFMGQQPQPKVEVGLREQRGDFAICFVRDNGVGIEESYQGQIFGLFERLDLEVDGTGIGLALVKRIIEAHGGSIWVESAGRGQGSTFVFELPVSQPGEGSTDDR